MLRVYNISDLVAHSLCVCNILCFRSHSLHIYVTATTCEFAQRALLSLLEVALATRTLSLALSLSLNNLSLSLSLGVSCVSRQSAEKLIIGIETLALHSHAYTRCVFFANCIRPRSVKKLICEVNEGGPHSSPLTLSLALSLLHTAWDTQ